MLPYIPILSSFLFAIPTVVLLQFANDVSKKRARLFPRWQSNGAIVRAMPLPRGYFHTFVSHVWSSGKDVRCARLEPSHS